MEEEATIRASKVGQNMSQARVIAMPIEGNIALRKHSVPSRGQFYNIF